MKSSFVTYFVIYLSTALSDITGWQFMLALQMDKIDGLCSSRHSPFLAWLCLGWPCFANVMIYFSCKAHSALYQHVP